jgi:prolipoprotein diacylglyceryltransferase
MPLAETTLVVVAGVALVASLWMARFDRVPWWRVAAGWLLLTLGAVVGARAYHLLAVDGQVSAHALLTGLTRPGHRHPGAVLGLLAATPLAWALLPRSVRIGSIADTAAFAYACAMPFWRIGCTIAGCCFGVRTDLPWGWEYPLGSAPWYHHVNRGWVVSWSDVSVTVHPLPLYFALLAVMTALALAWLRPRRQYPGQLALVFLVLHEGPKAFLETLRENVSPDTAFLAPWSAALSVLGATVLVLPSLRGMADTTQAASTTRGDAMR